MAVSGDFPKVDGDVLYAADGFSATNPISRYVANNAGGTYGSGSGPAGNIGSTITLPANKASKGFFIIATLDARFTTTTGANNFKGTINILSDSNITPVTTVYSEFFVVRIAGTNIDAQTAWAKTFFFFVTPADLSIANYAKLTVTSLAITGGVGTITLSDLYVLAC